VDEYDRRAHGASYEELHAAEAASSPPSPHPRRRARRSHRARLAAPALDARAGDDDRRDQVGYGLDLDTELDMLRAIRTAEALGSQRIFSTLLAAHAVPPEADDADSYIQRCVDEILPAVDEWGLATAADVFCERGAFDVDQSRLYLEKAKELGLDRRLHGDQFTEIGAIPLAVELEARSVDHLEATGAEGVAALAASDVIGVMLPSASLVLDRPMLPAAS